MHPVEFAADAETDAEEICDYLENLSPNLSLRFIDDVHTGIISIAKSPGSFHLYHNHKKIRRYNLTRFSYSIYYTVSGNRVLILAILHSKRSITFIKRRLI